MTFSLLVKDPVTGALAGAAATGAPCVGGWVLRGDARGGVSASQGKAPSTLWGDDTIAAMIKGASAEEALREAIGQDEGREFRQLSLLDRAGGVSAHSGASNDPWVGHTKRENAIAAGNILAGPSVLEALLAGYLSATGPLPERLLRALMKAEAVGGDTRGLESAAILVVSTDAPPVSLRVDLSERPLEDMQRLISRVNEPFYSGWLNKVPTRTAPSRAPVPY